MEIIITIVGFWLVLAISYAVYYFHTERTRKAPARFEREAAGFDYLPMGSFTGGPFEAPMRPPRISRTVPEFVARAGSEPAPAVTLVQRTVPHSTQPKAPRAKEDRPPVAEERPTALRRREPVVADAAAVRQAAAASPEKRTPKRSRGVVRQTRSYRRREAS